MLFRDIDVPIRYLDSLVLALLPLFDLDLEANNDEGSARRQKVISQVLRHLRRDGIVYNLNRRRRDLSDFGTDIVNSEIAVDDVRRPQLFKVGRIMQRSCGDDRVETRKPCKLDYCRL